MLQVFVLNLCYDVPVKLYSFHLLLMAVWIALPDLRRLADFLLFHRTVEPRPLRTPFERRWLERARRPVKLLVLGFMLYKEIDSGYDGYKKRGPGKARNPLHQIYKVERHTVAGVEKPPLTTDATRWKRFTLNTYGYAAIVYMDDHRAFGECKIDEVAKTMTIVVSPEKGKEQEKVPDIVLHYTQPDADHLELTGDVDGKPTTMSLIVVPRSSFLLDNRGFHWHQEYPFNR